MERLTLKAKEERRLLRGHLWVYRNELAGTPAMPDGSPVEVVSDHGRLVGRGYYQAEGGIAVRILCRERREFDGAFFRNRIDEAASLRKRIYPGEFVYRWVYAESDGLPGFVADRYGPVVVVHAASPFYADRFDPIGEAFLAHEGIEGVYFKTGNEPREAGNVQFPVTCKVNGVEFLVNPPAGQKTGLFLDQRHNWRQLEPFAKGAAVFDGFCYTGAWSLHAAQYGALHVIGFDSSMAAIETAREQARRNGFENVCSFECGDVREKIEEDLRYDVVILDPPAFAKSRRHTGKAAGLYQSLNRSGMAATNPGGILITSSCSGSVDQSAFLETIKRAANAARRQVRVLGVYGAGPDHPVLASMPETRYLKCAVLQVL